MMRLLLIPCEYFEIRSEVDKSVLDFSPPLPYMIIVQVLGYKDSIDNVTSRELVRAGYLL